MGLFRKKNDPITQRAKLLEDQIAAIEAEIQRLSDRAEHEGPGPNGHAAGPTPSPTPTPTSTPAPTPTPIAAHAPAQNQPRLRSTALPHHQTVAASASAPAAPATQPPATAVHAQEPVFEEVSQTRFPGLTPETESEPTPAPELGVRRNDAASLWQRFKHNFRGPVTSNPKLVHYLSAGSIQGLRPLRYEKRVARNRVIVLAAFLVLALWGVIAIFVSRR